MSVFLQRGRGLPPLAWRSKINQSNQKNITEYIRAGRCRSLPSSSIDLQSCSQCTTVLQMKPPNLIFSYNAAIRRHYVCKSTEYSPLDGNVLDSSVSEACMCVWDIRLFIGVTSEAPLVTGLNHKRRAGADLGVWGPWRAVLWGPLASRTVGAPGESYCLGPW